MRVGVKFRNLHRPFVCIAVYNGIIENTKAPSFLILADTTLFGSARVRVAFLLEISQTETSGLFSRFWQDLLKINVLTITPHTVPDGGPLRAEPREQRQGDLGYPGSILFFVWQCDKKNHVWREGQAADRRCQVSIW